MCSVQTARAKENNGKETSACSFEPQPADGMATAARRRAEIRLGHCEAMIDIAAALFNIPSKELRSPGRSAQNVSRVRQIAMYVCHVTLGITMTDVGKGFGRDRTTVLHACHLVEDMRDDEDFDGIVSMAERIAMAALRGRELTRDAG